MRLVVSGSSIPPGCNQGYPGSGGRQTTLSICGIASRSRRASRPAQARGTMCATTCRAWACLPMAGRRRTAHHQPQPPAPAAVRDDLAQNAQHAEPDGRAYADVRRVGPVATGDPPCRRILPSAHLFDQCRAQAHPVHQFAQPDRQPVKQPGAGREPPTSLDSYMAGWSIQLARAPTLSSDCVIVVPGCVRLPENSVTASLTQQF